jgi:hypothetical protein
MSPDGKKVLDEGKEIVRDSNDLPTLEISKPLSRAGDADWGSSQTAGFVVSVKPFSLSVVVSQCRH